MYSCNRSPGLFYKNRVNFKFPHKLFDTQHMVHYTVGMNRILNYFIFITLLIVPNKYIA